MSDDKKFIDRKLPGESRSEKIEYRGKFRIIGQIVNTRSDNNLLGYLLLNEQTYMFKAFSISQIKTLLAKFKFVNAELENGNIINTEKATHGKKISENPFDKLPSYNSRLKLISDANKFMVLGRVIEDNDEDDSEIVKFRVIDANLHIVELDENQLASYSNNGFTCVNGKFVNRQVKIKDPKTKNVQVVDKCIVSSLKGEFPIISKEKVKDTIEELKKKSDVDGKGTDFEKTEEEKKAEDYRHKKHIEKLIKNSPMMLTYGMGLAYGNTASNSKDGKESFRYRAVHYRTSEKKWYFKQDARIAVKEIFSKYIKDAKNKELLKKHWDNLVKENKMTNETYYGIAQFFLYIPGVYEQTIELALRYPRKIKYYLIDQKSSTPYLELKNKNLLCNKYLELEKELIQIIEQKYSKNKNKERAKRYIDDSLIKFKKSSEIAEIGFSISEKNEGLKYKTKDGRYFTLRYIGRDIADYEKYYERATCFGDLYTIKKMEELLEYINKDSTMQYFDSALKYIELFAILLSIYNPKLFKIYLRKLRVYFKNVVESSGFSQEKRDALKLVYSHLKNLDIGKDVDYKLDPKVDVYYRSGYTCFYSDEPSEEDKVINYRAKYGTRSNIKHSLLQTELVPILSILTSDRCSTKGIERHIGRLHWVYLKQEKFLKI